VDRSISYTPKVLTFCVLVFFYIFYGFFMHDIFLNKEAFNFYIDEVLFLCLFNFLD
jgi:hypothetical protein